MRRDHTHYRPILSSPPIHLGAALILMLGFAPACSTSFTRSVDRTPEPEPSGAQADLDLPSRNAVLSAVDQADHPTGPATNLADTAPATPTGTWTGIPFSIRGDVGTPNGSAGRSSPSGGVDVFGRLPVSSHAATWQTGTDGQANISRISFAGQGADFDPEVSRDGTRVVFASTRHNTHSDIYVKAINSRVVTQLTIDAADDVMPSLSPDGSRVAFASNRRGNFDIFVMPARGGQAIQITTGPSQEIHPTWSPDGRSLAFCRLGEVSGAWELWVTSLDNTTAAHFIGHGLFPVWSPVPGTGVAGSDKILFQRSRDRGDHAFSVWTIDYKDGQAQAPTEVISSPLAAFINPDWSPDGRFIVAASIPSPEAWADSVNAKPLLADLWMVSLDGNTRVNLTEGRFVNLMPSWGPGDELVFVSDRDGVDNLWSMNLGRALASVGAGTGSERASASAQSPATGSPTASASTSPDEPTSGTLSSVPDN